MLLLGIVYLAFFMLRRHYRIKQAMLQHTHAEQINEAKLQFFINIAHEVRTPMSLIISPLQKLMTSDADQARQNYYHTIWRNAQRILGLVNDLLDVRKIDKGQMSLTFRQVEITAFIRELCEAFNETANQRNITFTFLHEEMEQLDVWIDPKNFDKVLFNILSNAFKFTPDGGQVTISLSVSPPHAGRASYLEIRITDSGIGIPTEELEHIFDRFYQIHNAYNNQKTGSGIGLHLTRLLVELHHGRIYAQNLAEGKNGSCFVIEIPLGNAHLTAEEKETETATPECLTHPLPITIHPVAVSSDNTHVRPHTPYRILLVEDDDEVRHYLSQELSAEYYVTEACNGTEALEAIHKKVPDLVISDVMMPEMDGFTLCRKLKQHIHLNHIPVILLTAKTHEEDNIKGLETGADAYLTKPFNMDIVQKTVKNLISNRNTLRTVFSGEQEAPDTMVEEIKVPSPDERLMERIMKSINAHLSDESLTVEIIAAEVGLSRSHLHRKLKELTNQTTRDFIRNIRLKQAATLLGEKKHSISEVAALVGFSNLGNFSNAFKELFGVPPSAYTKQNKQDEK